MSWATHSPSRTARSGCFDLLHSGHAAFFKEAAQLGDLYVSVGNDACITQLKKAPMFPEDERAYMVASIRWVTHAFIAKGMGHSGTIQNVAYSRDGRIASTAGYGTDGQQQ